jgi:hypothetical protein
MNKLIMNYYLNYCTLSFSEEHTDDIQSFALFNEEIGKYL